jgi:acetyl-CoA carboxylase biotin carboxyl carrier protein
MEFENLITLIKAVSDSEVTGFKYEENGVKINISKKQGTTKIETTKIETTAAEPEIVRAEEKKTAPKKEEGKIVKSPLVGVFYVAPAEDAKPYVQVGDQVKKGQTLAIVEAMKLMNEIDSDYEGTVEEVYLENGQTVEYGQPLFRIV